MAAEHGSYTNQTWYRELFRGFSNETWLSGNGVDCRPARTLSAFSAPNFASKTKRESGVNWAEGEILDGI